MKINFYKFHGAGNDFILADNRNREFIPSALEIQQLCHRRFGIGADGLMLLENHQDADFRMVYYNSDGYEGSMCGNGARCMVAFAEYLGLIKNKASFIASDGMHEGIILEKKKSSWTISLQMLDVRPPLKVDNGYEINTGSPHLIIFQDDINSIDVVRDGRRLRFSEEYHPKGINVNFVQVIDHKNLQIRTYERGVENETLACGTGTVAAAIAAHEKGIRNQTNEYILKAAGGILKVSFSAPSQAEEIYRDIILTGPARMVFKIMNFEF
jgi:diaminopimelate epimerase